MNSNRNNNRRRGRNNRSQGGGQHLNRIDSRARGNAPQLLDKYRKMAEDAARNGDRVQSEYFLQFADHYFRVIADQKARQDEQRQKRDDHDDNRSRRKRDDDDDDSAENNDTTDDEDGDENPFTRDNRAPKGRGRGRGRRNDDDDADDDSETSEDEKPEKPKRTRKPKVKAEGLDPQALPPAIGDTDAPKPVRKPRARKVVEDSDDDVKQAANG